MNRVQKATATLFNRYAQVFRTLREAVRAQRGDNLGGADLRILSFGCSTGAEMLTARAYFPEATILGCDVDEGVLETAAEALREHSGYVFLSEAARIAAFAPYDIVFANSVLCNYPMPEDISDLTPHFPFSRFEELAGMILTALVPGGWFVLYNSNYSFWDLSGVSNFSTVRSPLIEANGFVDRFGRDGKRLTIVTKRLGQRDYDHRLADSAEPLPNFALRDCIFTRGLAVSFEFGGAGGACKGQLILGLDPWSLAQEGRVGAGLYEEIVATEDGPVQRREWRKSTFSGCVEEFGIWETPAGRSLDNADLLYRIKGKRSRLSRFMGRFL